MLTLKLITEETERVVRGLEKKHFKGAREAIEQVLAVDKRRREAQQQSDKIKQEVKELSSQVGALMKQGKREESSKKWHRSNKATNNSRTTWNRHRKS